MATTAKCFIVQHIVMVSLEIGKLNDERDEVDVVNVKRF